MWKSETYVAAKRSATLVFVYLKDFMFRDMEQGQTKTDRPPDRPTVRLTDQPTNRPTDRPAQRPIFFDVPLPPSVSVSAFVSGSVSVSVLSALGHAFRNHGQLGIIVTMGGRRLK